MTHSGKRQRQRGICDVAVQIATRFGKRYRAGGKRYAHRITPAALRKARECGLKTSDDRVGITIIRHRKQIVTVMWAKDSQALRLMRRGNL